MSRLDELIQQYCPDGVEYKTLNKVAKVTSGSSAPQDSESFSDDGTPFCRTADVGRIRQSVNFTEISDRITDKAAKGMKLMPVGTILIPKSGASTLLNNKVRLGVEAYVVSHLAAIIADKTQINDKYLYYALTTFDITTLVENPSYPSLKTTTIGESIEIPVPPLPVQEEIVRILDKFTELEQELEQELELRKKQYEYYRDKMLSLSDYDGEVKVVPLRDVLKEQIHTGLNPRKFFQVNTDDATNYYVTIREMVDGHIEFNDRTDRLNDEAMQLCQNRSKLEDGCLLFSGTGTIGVVVLVDKKPDNWNIKEGVYVIKPNQDIVLSSFMKYALQSRQFIKAYSTKIVGGTVKSIPMKELMDVEIAYPTDVEYQKLLVEKLDKFSTLTSDISEGLPAEIKMRHQQYEYYRDKLLNFKRLEEA